MGATSRRVAALVMPAPLRRTALVLPAALVVAALGLAACSNGNVTTLSTPPTTDAALTLTLQRSPVGPIVATGTGATLYDFAPDTPTHSACQGDPCIVQWPPLVVTGPVTLGRGLHAGLVGTLKRPDGSTQVTYGGHPLYTYDVDVTAGMVTGQGVDSDGGLWYVIGADGKQITTPFSVQNPDQNPNT